MFVSSHASMINDNVQSISDKLDQIEDFLSYNHLSKDEVVSLIKQCRYRLADIEWSIEKI